MQRGALERATFYLELEELFSLYVCVCVCIQTFLAQTYHSNPPSDHLTKIYLSSSCLVGQSAYRLWNLKYDNQSLTPKLKEIIQVAQYADFS